VIQIYRFRHIWSRACGISTHDAHSLWKSKSEFWTCIYVTYAIGLAHAAIDAIPNLLWHIGICLIMFRQESDAIMHGTCHLCGDAPRAVICFILVDW